MSSIFYVKCQVLWIWQFFCDCQLLIAVLAWKIALDCYHYLRFMDQIFFDFIYFKQNMKKTVNFLKSFVWVILWIILGITVLTVDALSIPTNIDNAVQTIKTVYISTDGISTTGDNVVVRIDNVSGAALTVRGNMNVGDRANSVSGTWSTVAGWVNNYLTWDYSIIVWWSDNRINANRSVAMWKTAEALHNSTFVWADDTGWPFQSRTGKTFLIRANRWVAIGTSVTLWMNSLRVWNGTTGRVAAKEYCDENGTGCILAGDLGSGGTGYRAKSGVNIYGTGFTGNVGIGTTNPDATLHVVGSFIAGESDNDIINSPSYPSIIFGATNVISGGARNVIAGWLWNKITESITSFIWWWGGFNTIVDNSNSSLIIWWSSNDIIHSVFSSLVWWYDNAIYSWADADGISFLWWGQGNIIATWHRYSLIVWWYQNRVFDRFNVIWGWRWNVVTWSRLNVIVWWYGNLVNWEISNIVWWYSNVIAWSWYWNFVGGWAYNKIFWQYSSIWWWNGNTVATWATYGTIPGWSANVVSGNYSLAAWRAARAIHDNSFVWSDGVTFSSTNYSQFLIRATNGVGINTASPTEALTVVGWAQIDGTTFNVDEANNRVWIWTAAPTQTLTVSGNIIIGSNSLYLKDTNHGIWYRGDTINGPVVYGYGGGALGWNHFGTTTWLALQWYDNGNVTIYGLLKLKIQDASVPTCDTSSEWSIVYSAYVNKPCYCGGSPLWWKTFDDNTTCAFSLTPPVGL